MCVAIRTTYVDQLAGFDDVGLRRDLDVAVGVRHAGDVAGSLERRFRRAVDDAHSIELVTAGGRHDAPRERHADDVRQVLVAAAPSVAASAREAGSAFDRHEVGYPRHAEHGLAGDACRESVGLPGFTAMPWKITSPASCSASMIRVPLADGASSREDEDIGISRRLDRSSQVAQAVGCDSRQPSRCRRAR